MSANENAVLAQKIYQFFSDDRFDEIMPLAAEDMETVLVPFGQTFRGPEGFRDFMKGFKSAFPDITINQIVSQIATDEAVVSEFTARGTHTGPLMTPMGEVPPTGRTVDFTVCEVWQIRDGKVTSLHNYQDAAGLMRHLGLLPEPAAAG